MESGPRTPLPTPVTPVVPPPSGTELFKRAVRMLMAKGKDVKGDKEVNREFVALIESKF